MDLLFKPIRTIYFFLVYLLAACQPVLAAVPAVETAAPPLWIKTIAVPPVSDLPLDEIKDGQYFLLVDKQIRVVDNAPTHYYRHYAIHVVNATGMEAASQISIGFDPEYEVLRFHRLSIHRDGNIIDKLPHTDIQLLRREEDLESNIYDGRYTADIIVDDIRVGDIIEYAYTLTGENPIYSNSFSYHLDTNWNVPVGLNHFRLLWPNTRRLYQKSHNTDKVLASQGFGSHTVYTFRQENVRPVNRNSETPEWFRRYGHIQIAETETWRDVVAWALPLYEPAYRNDAAIKLLAERICQPAANDEDRVILLLNYVQNEIRYLGIEFGVNSHKPSLPQVTLERRYGDCKDKTVTLIALLTAMGFETRPVLVNTSLQKGVADLHPTARAFDHVIARTTVNGKHYWLDPVRKYQGQNLAKVFQPDYGMALVVAPGETGLTEIPPNNHLVGVHIEETFDLREGFQKAPSYRLMSHFQGLNAEKIRRWLAEDGIKTIEQNYLNFYAKYYTKIETSESIKILDDPKNNVLNLQESYRIKNFWENNDDTHQWESAFYTNALYSYLNKPKQRQRHEPFGIEYPVDVRQTIRILLPEPWDIEPADFTEHNAHFKFTAKSSFDSNTNTITLDYHYRSLKDAVQPGALSDYIAALDRVNDELDYQLSKPTITNASLSRQAVLDWVQSNPILVIAIAMTFLLLYCAIEWRLDSFKPLPAEKGFYYPVSLLKFLVLSFATFGLYPLFWFYQNWKYIKQRDDSAIMPFWRAVFIPIWFFDFYRDLKLDSEQRFGKSILPRAFWIVMLLLLLIVSNATERFDGPFALLGLLGALSLLPFANYILFINRHQPATVKHYSTIRIRHYLLSVLAASIVFFNIGVYLNLLPSGHVVKGSQLPRWDIKFMQRLGILDGDAQLIYFYSDAFLITRNDGNGVTDKNVFSYWYDHESDALRVKSADFEDIEDISINHAASTSDTTVITVKPKSGATFVLYASGEEGRDKLFVKAIQDRLTPRN